MKVVLLAGGLGTRISEETDAKPKPMVLIDDKPILWHVMKIYASQGFRDFIIATGYKGEVIQDWVGNLQSPWNIQVMDTGVSTQTSGRIRMCATVINEERFMVTYGDGLANVDITKLINHHNFYNRLVTVTAVRPPARFGFLQINQEKVVHFGEKNIADESWINGGFFVIEKEALNYIDSDQEPFEQGALPRLAASSNLSAYKHFGFWQPMDTLRERNELAKLASENPAPWLVKL